MIGIIDYGLGNIKAFQNIYERLKIPCQTLHTAKDLNLAKGFILPGVGSFDKAVDLLENSGMKEGLLKKVQEDGAPLLGICIGMHLLGNSSEEGQRKGLGIIPGQVKKLHNIQGLPLPHMGWNNVFQDKQNPLFKDIPDESEFYFLHSYYFQPDSDEHQIASFDYPRRFGCGVFSKNIFGIQFHPEKSHQCGEKVLTNFGELCQ